MKRRIFITKAVPVSLLTSVLISNGLTGCRFGQSDPRKRVDEGRVLVLIQLDGGNDGLNTVIPLDQYPNLIKTRKNILLPEKKVLPLNNSPVTGLHPALGALQGLYNNKQLSIIQGVGCPHPDLSHFRSIDIWHSGDDSSTTVYTGWLGRYLDQDGHDAGNNDNDPPAIQIGSALSKALQGATSSAGTVVRDLNFFYDLDPGQYDPIDVSGNSQLSFLRKSVVESKYYLQKVKIAADRQKSLSSLYPAPGSNPLADQLKTTARLIGGGLQTKVYIVNLKGFDTHDDQADRSDATKGAHAELLGQLSTAIAAFNDDLLLMGKQDMVISMVYSEFGRRIKSNFGYGTDHGTSAPVMLFGSKVKGGLIGRNPEIPPVVTVSDNLPLQNDFRSVYASVLKGWFGVPEHVIKSTLRGTYPTLDLFN